MIKTMMRLGMGIVLCLSVHSSVWGWQTDGIDNLPGGLNPPPGQVPNQPPGQPFQVEPGVNPGFQRPAPDQDLQLSSSSGLNESKEDELILVREKYAGWQAASEMVDGQRISNLLRSNWVMADPNGKVEGQVFTIGSATIENFDIYLFKSGRLVSTADVEANGSFTFTNITEGAYSLAGVGDNAFFTFGFNAIGFRESSQIPTQLNVTAFQNKTTINLDWIRYFAPNIRFRVFGQYSTEQEGDDPAHLYGYEGIQAFPPAASPATSIQNHLVKRAKNGNVRGRIHQFNSLHGRPVNLLETKVMLLQEDNVVGSTTTDLYGVFEFENVAAGEYAVVAAGTDGLGCIGINVVNEGGDAAHMIDFTLASAETVGWLNQNAIRLAYDRVIMRPQPKKPQQDCQFCGMNNGCCGCGGQGYGMNGQRRQGFFRKVTSGVNRFFDILFYPEEYQGYGNGYGGGYGNGYGGNGNGNGYGNGYGGYGNGYGPGYGYYGENGYGAYQSVLGGCMDGSCGRAGCSTCGG